MDTAASLSPSLIMRYSNDNTSPVSPADGTSKGISPIELLTVALMSSDLDMDSPDLHEVSESEPVENEIDIDIDSI